MEPELHPAVANVLRFFDFEHLPQPLQVISAPFKLLAGQIAGRTINPNALGELADGPETTVALRKLLEAKDAAVRAAL